MFHRVRRSLFQSKDDAGASSDLKEGTVSRLGTGFRLNGEIRGRGDLALQGQIEGSLRIEGSVEIGPEGCSRGLVEAQKVRLRGTVEGEIRVAQQLLISSSGVLSGKLQAPRLVIEEGGRLLGSCRMLSAAPETEPARPNEVDSDEANAASSLLPPLEGAVEG